MACRILGKITRIPCNLYAPGVLSGLRYMQGEFICVVFFWPLGHFRWQFLPQ